VSQLKPLFDRVLVQVAEAKAASKGGVLLPGAPRVACAALASRR
jgi:co-chaperonin GroES (HSP10)